ncbi:DNA-binding transcriptional regulator HcaR [Acinetobacter puyangensis]|uniref:LysR family transcriptional regulator, hca operon transcriptional activator n=1 Tax=Acinetobacter puyangensis TaxID=1096779 RepID=A0A240E3H4_9GAMM|nr:LysR substrate-binding domain-containing protein [Acinetobacter puyangensis]SNX43132.1 LysR family transcriptional regulator, hca operon transcriptional activator [Acinetobacter puyangensis]
MLALRHLRYFVAISEEISFVAAAKKLNTVQSSLSQQMKDLEDYIGVDLFERGSRVIALTKTGEVFLQEAKKALIEAEKTQNFAMKLKGRAKDLKIGMMIGVEVKIPKYFIETIKQNSATMQVEIISAMSLPLIQMLEKGEIDIAFSRSNINNQDISSHEFLVEDLLIILPKDHPLNKYSHIPVKELNGINLVIPALEHAPELYNKILKIFTDHHIEPNIVAETENPFVTMSYVNMGMGITILPDNIRTIATNDVTIKKFLRIQPKISLFMNYRNSEKPSLEHLLHKIIRSA